MIYRRFLLAALSLVATLPAFAAPVRDQFVEAELVPAQAAVVPGQPFLVALRLNHDPHWHTYFINPGGPGLPTDIAWKLPAGFTAGPIQWAVPKKTSLGDIVTYGYEDEVMHLVEITPPADLAPGTAVNLRAQVTWLMCKETCVPGEAALSLALPVASATGPHPTWGARVAQWRDRLPPRSDALQVGAYREGDKVTLRIAGSAVRADLAQAYFFPDAEIIDADAPQPLRRAGDAWLLEFKLAAHLAKQPIPRVGGYLTAEGGWLTGGGLPAAAISAEVVDGPVPPAVAGTTTDGAAASSSGGFAGILLFALLGGLILNLMPCVFPVLGIKIMGFVNQAGEHPGRVVAHGLVFTAGVLASFWVLAGALIALRAGGAQLGWGFQLQSPGFVYALTALLLLFGLSMSGVFEVGGGLIGTGSGLQARSGLGGSFFSGVLATVVATPCAAPFLAPALGAALALPPAQSLLTFTAIAVGLALPYLLLSAFPRAIRLLPRPGAWMETFKQGMAFLLYATVGYLVWVLAGQVDGDRLLGLLLGLVTMAVAAWVYGRWSTPVRRPAVRRVGAVVAALLLVGGYAYGMPRSAQPTDDEVVWEPWSAARVAELQRAGRPIYVDFTARWCVTCQANKKLVFGSAEVRRFFRKRGVVALRADWTNRDSAITEELRRFGRSAVPFNLVYLPGQPEPVALPEVLTPGIVLDALRPAAGS